MSDCNKCLGESIRRVRGLRMIQTGEGTPFEKVTRERLSEMATVKQKHARSERISRVLRAKRKTNAKALR